MNAKFRIIGICLSIFMLAACAAPLPKRPFIDQAIWSETTKDKTYTACLTALTMEGFDMHPVATNKDIGLIVTGQKEFYFQKNGGRFKEIICFYNLQFLVAEAQGNKIMVTVHVKPGWRYTEKIAFIGVGDGDIKSYTNNRASEDLEKVFAQIDILLGKAQYYRRDKVLWEE